MIEHLSHSSISMYLACPESWRRKYIAKEQTATSPALVFGSAFHNTIESFAAGKGGLLSLWQESWANQLEKEPNVAWDLDTPEQHCNEGIRILGHTDVAAAIQQIKPGYDEQGAKIERKIELHVPGVPVPVIGYIDIILADGTPADLKTSARSWSADKAAEEMQSLYYLAALNQAGIKHDWRFRHIIFVKTKTPQVQILEHSHKPAELFFLFEMIKRIWEAINTGVFPLNPSSWKCNPSYCDFYMQCRGRYV